MKTFFKIFTIFISLLFIYAGDSLAQSNPASSSSLKNIETQIVKFPDFVRFNFKSDDYIIFDPVISGNMLIIDFEKPNNLNLSNLVGKASLLQSFGVSPDNKSMIIRLNNTGIKLRKFVGDNFTTGIDIFMEKGSGEYQRKVVMMSAPPNGNTKNTEPPEAPDSSSILSSNIITYPLNFVGPPRIEQLFRVDPEFIGPAPKILDNFTVYEIIKTYNENTTEIEIAETEEGSTLILFPFADTSKIGSSVQLNGDILTALFSKKGVALIPSIIPTTLIESITQSKNDKAIVVNIKLNNEELKKLPTEFLTYRNKYSWVIEIVRGKSQNEDLFIKPVQVNVSNQWGENLISMPASGIEGPFTINDTKSGELINVFTIKDNGKGVLLKREFVDLKVMKSLQGMFIEEKSDFINYKIEDDKLLITKLPNLIISDEIIATDFSIGDGNSEMISKTMGIFPDQSVFPFHKSLMALEKMKNISNTEKNVKTTKDMNKKEVSEDGDTKENSNDSNNDSIVSEDLIEDLGFYENIVTSLDNIIEADNEEKKSDEKLKLAEYYFSKNMYPESLGILYDIMIDDPGYNSIFRVESIYAATLYLTGKYEQSYKEFSILVDESLNNSSYNEFKLWKWFSQQQKNKKLRIKGEDNIKIDFISSYDKFMQQYDDNLKFKFGLIYIEDKIDRGQIEEAKNILEVITYSDFPKEFENDVKFIKAKFALDDNNSELALKSFKELIADVSDRKNRARALFELTKYNLINGISSTEDAIENFLKSSTIWRDDYFEMDIYETVGSLQLSKKNYMGALGSWENLVSNFPQTTESIFILGKMKEVFIELFDGNIAYEMEPLEALKIYFKYRELMPVGEVGDRIARKIAQFFISVDMVEDAIDIVLHQIKYRSTGEEKAKLVLWLSNIYRKNRGLDSAEEVLNIAKEENNLSQRTKDLIRYETAYIKAKKGLYNEGLELLKNDFSEEANDSRIELFWIRENWFGLTNLVEAKLDSIRETAPEPLTSKEMSYITKLAVAYASQGENKKLTNLKEAYMSRIKDNNDIKLFEYLSSGDSKVDHNHFQETIELNKIERFMNEYSFLPNKNWENVIEVLEPKVKKLLNKKTEDFTRQDTFDVVRLALAYTLLRPEDLKLDQIVRKKMNTLARDFKNITIDRFSIDALASSLGDQFLPIEGDAIFEGKIKLVDLPKFLDFYKKAKKMSQLNISIRDKFK